MDRSFRKYYVVPQPSKCQRCNHTKSIEVPVIEVTILTILLNAKTRSNPADFVSWVFGREPIPGSLSPVPSYSDVKSQVKQHKIYAYWAKSNRLYWFPAVIIQWTNSLLTYWTHRHQLTFAHSFSAQLVDWCSEYYAVLTSDLDDEFAISVTSECISKSGSECILKSAQSDRFRAQRVKSPVN